MEKIKKILAREILDSRGNPTVECDVVLEDGSFGRAAVPSGASTGIHEALELRDGDKKRYLGKGVKKAIQNINELINKEIINKQFDGYRAFDRAILELDNTENKSKIGANATLAASLAFAKSLSSHSSKDFFKFISENEEYILPVPMMNIVNGGSHADNDVDIQEFMIAPVGAPNFSEALRYGCEIFHSLKSILKSKNLNTNVGDEGGFAPNLNSSEEVLKIIIEAVEKANYKMEEQVSIALDAASSEFYSEGKYLIEEEELNSSEMVSYLIDLSTKFPIVSIEDGLAEDDWDGWNELTSKIGETTQLVGDDLFVTQAQMLEKGITEKSANSILIKVNQVGSISETYETMQLAKESDFTSMVSHRSGETENIFISHLVAGTSSGQIKTGAPARSERTAKYNELLRIGEVIGLDNFNNQKWNK